MRYLALVKGLDPHIEEEVILEVQGIEFTGFAFICPYEIEAGKKYPVSIGFTILDGLEIREICDSKKEFERIGTSFNYYIRGILNEDSIDAGIVISDNDEYFANYPDLIGKTVEFQVDRISVEFLKD